MQDTRRVVPRPALERRLNQVMGRRLTLLVAPPGSGKTTLLTQWASTVHATWCVPRGEDVMGLVGGVVDALRLRVPDLATDVTVTLGGGRGTVADAGQVAAAASALADGLAGTLTRDLALVLDDVVPVASPVADRFVWELVRQAPRQLHVVVSGRRAPGFPTTRLARQGELLEMHGRELVLDEDEVAHWLEVLVEPDPALLAAAGRVRAATGGWPPAVRHVATVLAGSPRARRPAELARLLSNGIDTGTLVDVALEAHDQPARRVLQVLAVVPDLEPAMCAALDLGAGEPELERLQRDGLFVEAQPDRPGAVRLRRMVRAQVADALPLDDGDRDALLREAADWFLQHGRVGAALQCLQAADAPEALATVLEDHGHALAEQGHTATVRDALDALPAASRGAWTDELRGLVLQLEGDWDGALEHLEAAARSDPAMAVRAAWRIGLIHHLRGELDRADAAYRRGEAASRDLPEDRVDPGSVALLHAWWASTRWLAADREGCRSLAQQAVEEATAARDDRALAASHTALAMLAALDGDRATNDAHYLRALEHAERAGDVLQVIRIRTNRGSHHLEQGATAEAMAELDTAVRLAELTGFSQFRGIALANRGEVQLATGRLQLARADLEQALAEWGRQGSRMRSYALRLLAELEVIRGDVARARLLLEECLALTEPTGDVQGIVPAAAALARLLAEDDPEAARRHRDVALAHETSMDRTRALVAAAEVGMILGEPEQAADWARQAADVARRRRDPGGEVDALLVQARLAADHDTARGIVDRADVALGQHPDPLRRARVELARAEHADPATAVAIATDVRDRMRLLGAGELDARATAVLQRFGEHVEGLEIRTFGGFRLLRRGRVVPVQEWQSRRARDLLKILVARRGRPVPRDELLELLWPDEDSDRLADRLNVTLSTLRGVLDPERRQPADHVVVSAEGAVQLDLEHVVVDLEELLADVDAAERLQRVGRLDEARERDRRAVAWYRGAFLDEHAYDDWAVPAREQARAGFLAAARRLAAAAGDTDTEVRFLLRVLEEDPYDEPAHLRLVRCLQDAGRHGEARRAYQHYTERMVELDLEPTPYPVAGDPT